MPVSNLSKQGVSWYAALHNTISTNVDYQYAGHGAELTAGIRYRVLPETPQKIYDRPNTSGLS
jgi:hypothetical protein